MPARASRTAKPNVKTNREVRKIMYTTNPIESVNYSLRKVVKQGALPNEDAVLKVFYLCIQELRAKRDGRKIPNRASILNELLIDDKIGELIHKYDSNV